MPGRRPGSRPAGTGDRTEAAGTAAVVIADKDNAPAGPHVEALVVLALVRARRNAPGCWPLLDEAHARAGADGRQALIARVAIARAEAAWLEGRPDAIDTETNECYGRAVDARCVWAAAELATWRLRAGLAAALPSWACHLHRLQDAGKWQRAAVAWQVRGFPYEASLAQAEASEAQPLRNALATLRTLGASAAVGS